MNLTPSDLSFWRFWVCVPDLLLLALVILTPVWDRAWDWYRTRRDWRDYCRRHGLVP